MDDSTTRVLPRTDGCDLFAISGLPPWSALISHPQDLRTPDLRTPECQNPDMLTLFGTFTSHVHEGLTLVHLLTDPTAVGCLLKIRNSLKGLQVLIVLDDVDDREKIKSVLDINAVEPGSLIFITSRDKDILMGSSSNTLLYDVKPFQRNHALELFYRHAFHQSNPLEGYEDSVEEFLKICGGLPLCLKVLGEQLAGKLDRTYWKRQLEIFSQGLPLTEADTVINTLEWSYKALEIEQQEMLLDVGCFFVGENLELGYLSDVRNCLESLRPKCLVDFNNDVESEDEIGNQDQDIAISEGKHLILRAVLAQRNPKL